MFSGSRCCLRTKVNKRLLPSEILLHQPLLYTRWFGTQHEHNSTRPSAHEPSEGTKQSRNYILSERSEKAQAEVVQPFKFQHVPQQPSQNSSEAQPHTSRSIRLRLETTSKENLEAIIHERKARQGIVVPELLPSGLRRRAYFPAQGSTSSVEQREKRERNKRSAFTGRSSWERTLNMLANSVPQHKEAEGQEIWLSKQTLIALSGTSGTNSWVHNVRGGCEVQVTDTQSSSGTARQVLLRGSTRAVALTREHFVALEMGEMQHQGNQPDLGSTGMPHELLPKTVSSEREANAVFNPNVLIRTVLTADKSHLRHGNWMRADGLPQSAMDSVRCFKEYVEELTTTRAPRLVRRELYRTKDDRHNMVVADILCHLFTDKTTAVSASAVALNLAFAFLCRHTELFHQTNLLYHQCRQLRLAFQPHTYNYILRALVLQKEVTMFGRVLDDLLSDGHRPDSKIWLALLKSGSSVMQKRTIADWMYRKDLLENSLVKGEVAAEIITAELSVKAHYGMHADVFLESIDARFGRDWMSRLSVTRAMMACADNKAWNLAVEMFREAQRRGVNFDHTVLPAMLSFMQRRGSLRDSLDLLRSHFVRTTGRNDHVLVPIIFMTAWRHRFYNVSRVLWRYAAVQGAITYKMQNVVTESLLRNQDLHALHAGKAGLTTANLEWRHRAGKVLVGTDLDIKGFRQTFDLVGGLSCSTSENPMVWLAQYTSDGGQRDQQSSLAFVMMHRDLEAWKHFAPPRSERLFKLLSDAYAMDVQWKSEGIGLDRGGKSTPWMIENAVDVPFVKREISVASGPAYKNKRMSGFGDEQASVFAQCKDVAHDDSSDGHVADTASV